ncbi:hypothetical protein [Streptobacillus moniliformis]|uniref:hypothetical protein n=1 Tax=Streptobacillus moniliformis TaxID=34105 RepID=UPI000AB8C793|nr:hypothetical protein [Streptobacillus moniliformis]
MVVPILGLAQEKNLETNDVIVTNNIMISSSNNLNFLNEKEEKLERLENKIEKLNKKN